MREDVIASSAVEGGEVVVQLEHRVRPEADRVVDLGVVDAPAAGRAGKRLTA
jgi:hypothetical protein